MIAVTRVSANGKRKAMLHYVPLFDRQGRFSPLKAVTLTGLLAPFAYLLFRAAMNDLGPLAVMESIHVTGDWAIRFLVATLALTPLTRIYNWPKLALVRRMAGIGAFSYAAMHFSLFIGNAKYNLVFVAAEIGTRTFLLIGFVGLLGLSALAVTSTDRALRAMGQRWKTLHKCVYGISVLALLHAFMSYKLDVTPAVLVAGFYLLLMNYRLVLRMKWKLNWLSLAGASITAGAGTMLLECAWYGVATGIDPLRLLEANITIANGIRPAITVMAVGLLVAVAQAIVTHFRLSAGKKRVPATSRQPSGFQTSAT
jgi:methionine sulfoxide reductase heme-binding subunit